MERSNGPIDWYFVIVRYKVAARWISIHWDRSRPRAYNLKIAANNVPY